MEACNGRSGRTALRHVHESKASRVAGLAVGNHIDRVHSAIQLEELSEVRIGRGARKVANKNVHTKVLSLVGGRGFPPLPLIIEKTSLESGKFCEQTKLNTNTRWSNFAPHIEMCDRTTTRTLQSRHRVPQTEESTVLSGGAVCACARASIS